MQISQKILVTLSSLSDNENRYTKLQYFEKLSVDYNSKQFWKACKPYFSNKNSPYTRK